MAYVFSSESVAEGHPDKVADQIADAILDHHIAFDPKARVACEVLLANNLIVLAGEIKSKARIDTNDIVRAVVKDIGYTDEKRYGFDAQSCRIQNILQAQSPEISQLVDGNQKQQGAGDQGIMFGYATAETDACIPLTLYLAHDILYALRAERKQNGQHELGPDAKSQVWVRYDANHQPQSVEKILISTQHTQDMSLAELQKCLKEDFYPRWKKKLDPQIQAFFNSNTRLVVNPKGSFNQGGPNCDSGLTGRKIIVDTYGGWGAHGGGAFSGKDPSKVDRSAAYMARYVAKHIVKAGIASRTLVQLSYIIGSEQVQNFYVHTYGTAKNHATDDQITKRIQNIKGFELTPAMITQRLQLQKPMYFETAAYGHMGRTPQQKKKYFLNPKGEPKTADVNLFTWEKVDDELVGQIAS